MSISILYPRGFGIHPGSNTFSSGNSGGVVGDGGGLEDLCELWKKSAGDFCAMAFCKHITLEPGGIGNC